MAELSEKISTLIPVITSKDGSHFDIEQYELIKQYEIMSMMRHFVRFYEFLLQVSCFEDTDLHKKYNFITYLLAYINIKHPGGGYNLDGKIKATNFVQKKAEEHTTPNLVAQPVVKLPTAETFGLTEAKEERLSQIIAEINSRTGKAYDNDVAVKAMLICIPFVVETADAVYLVEVKGEDKLNDPDVIAKKKRGVQYCEVASRWGKANGYKEWQYLFIPSKQVMPNSSFMQLAKQFHTL